MVGQTRSAYKRITELGARVGNCLALLCIHHINQLNCHNGSAIITASVSLSWLLLPPPKEVMFLVRSVCLSDNWKSCKQISTKFLGGVQHGPRTNEFHFGDDPDHRPDPGVRSPKSAFTRSSKKFPMDFDEILWRAWVWPRDQLITFRWRSGSPSRSRNPKSGFTGFWRSAEVCVLWALLVNIIIIKLWGTLTINMGNKQT